jgi:hypothetical protein
MPSYICMIFARDDTVLKVETFVREDDVQAEREAVAIMTSTQDTRGYELWSGGKKVSAHLTKRTSPWNDAPSTGAKKNA